MVNFQYIIDTMKLYLQVCSQLSMRIKQWNFETDIDFYERTESLMKEKVLNEAFEDDLTPRRMVFC